MAQHMYTSQHTSQHAGRSAQLSRTRDDLRCLCIIAAIVNLISLKKPNGAGQGRGLGRAVGATAVTLRRLVITRTLWVKRGGGGRRARRAGSRCGSVRRPCAARGCAAAGPARGRRERRGVAAARAPRGSPPPTACAAFRGCAPPPAGATGFEPDRGLALRVCWRVC